MNSNRAYPRVSIITPVFNQAEYLEETIESVLSQSYPNIEYIVLDDGSTDHTRDILKKYEGKIQYESHENMGQARTLNKGWKMSKGEILSYLSSDDILDVDAISLLVAKLDRGSSIVFGNYRLIDEQSKKIKTKNAPFFGYKDMVQNFNCPIGPGAIFTRDLFSNFQGWKEEFRLLPDYDFWIRAGRNARFIKVDQEIAGFRVHTGSQTFASSTPTKSDESIACISNFFSSNMEARFEFNHRQAFASAFIFSSCMHLRSGRYVVALRRFCEAVKHGGYYAISKRNGVRLCGAIYSIFKYKHIK